MERCCLLIHTDMGNEYCVSSALCLSIAILLGATQLGFFTVHFYSFPISVWINKQHLSIQTLSFPFLTASIVCFALDLSSGVELLFFFLLLFFFCSLLLSAIYTPPVRWCEVR